MRGADAGSAPFCVRAGARLHWPAMAVRCPDSPLALQRRRARALALAAASLLAIDAAGAATLADRARESGCTTKPVPMSSALFKCTTSSGAEAFFNVPDGRSEPAPSKGASGTSAPANFPRVDADTQKARDDLRKKVLTDELATEEKLLADARTEYGNGAPAPLPEEKADAERYRQRIEHLRQSVQLHERNIDALKKELGR